MSTCFYATYAKLYPEESIQFILTHRTPHIQTTLVVNLPLELLDDIASYLTPTSLKRLSHTCQLFRGVTKRFEFLVRPRSTGN